MIFLCSEQVVGAVHARSCMLCSRKKGSFSVVFGWSKSIRQIASLNKLPNSILRSIQTQIKKRRLADFP